MIKEEEIFQEISKSVKIDVKRIGFSKHAYFGKMILCLIVI